MRQDDAGTRHPRGPWSQRPDDADPALSDVLAFDRPKTRRECLTSVAFGGVRLRRCSARGFFPASGFWGAIPRSPLHDVSNRLAHALTSNPPHSSFHRHQEAQEAREDLHEGYGPQVPSQPALLQEAPERWQAGVSLGSSFSGGCCAARARARVGKIWGILSS